MIFKSLREEPTTVSYNGLVQIPFYSSIPIYRHVFEKQRSRLHMRKQNCFDKKKKNGVQMIMVKGK